jgi:hemerythrin
MSEFFQWDKSLDLGVREMNAEHKQLIMLMNALHEHHLAKASCEVLKTHLDALKEFTVQHFREEEIFMQQMQYPKLETHKIIHADLLRKFQVHYENFKGEGVLRQEFFDFLLLWLSAHIRGIDMQYADHHKKMTIPA